MLLHGLVEKVASENPRKEAVIFNDRKVTYQELNERAEQFAIGLIELGVQRGDGVAILMPSTPEYIVTVLGCWKAGAAIVPINYHYTNPEIAYSLNNANVSVLIMTDQYKKYNYLERLPDIKNQVPALREIVLIRSSGSSGGPATVIRFEDLFVASPSEKQRDEMKKRKSSASSEDTAYLVFTGGTTGVSKAVIITHRARYTVDKGWGDVLNVSSDERILVNLPLFHLYVWHTIIRAFISGATIILMEEFDTDLSLKLVEKEKVTFLAEVPTMYIYQMNAPGIEKYNLSSLRVGLTGGAIFPEELFDLCEKKLGGLRIINFYGLSDDGGVVTLSRLDDSFEHARKTVGKAIPGVELKIVDEDRKEVPLNTTGEVAVRSSWMSGYYNMPEETKKAIDREGWLYTGDLGALDANGYLYFKGRTKDMFISGGENIYPMEIESALQKHPKILMAAVIGIPHPKMGEVGRVFIVPKENQTMSEGEVMDYLGGKLAKIKIPREIVFCESLPMTSVGKIKKDDLRKK